MDFQNFEHLLRSRCLLSDGDTIIVGVSGGPDSMALLNLLHFSKLSLKLICVYVDHGLRPDEIDDEKLLVGNSCQQLNIIHEIKTVDVRKHQSLHGTSLEESCRTLRYQTLEECRVYHSAAAVAVGHTSDDQAEELLLRLIRGTGLTGLSGMRWRNKHIIRPLLSTTKDELIAYLVDKHIVFCNDSTNHDTRFLRNRIRHCLMPHLRKNYNKSIRSTLLKTTEILKTDDDFIQLSVQNELKRCVVIRPPEELNRPLVAIDIPAFLQAHAAIQRRIMENCCWQAGARPNYLQITQLCKLIAQGRTGAEMHLRSGLRAVKYRQHLCFFQGKKRHSLRHASEKRITELHIETIKNIEKIHCGLKIKLEVIDTPPSDSGKNAILLDVDKITPPLSLRPHLPGEKFSPSGMEGSKKVARFLSDCKIPGHLRWKYPVLTDRNSIIAISGLRPDRRCVPDESTRHFLLFSWFPTYGGD